MTEENKEETKPISMDNGNLVVEKKPSMILEAHEAAEKLKAENDRLEKNIAQLQEIKAVDTLGGKSDAGEQPPVEKEETPAEYTKRIQEELRTGKRK